MTPPIYRALVGMVAGALATYLLCVVAMAAYLSPSDDKSAAQREKRADQMALGISFAGGLLCAAIGGVTGHGGGPKTQASRPHRGHRGLKSILTDDQIRKLILCALPFDIRARTQDYLQGLLVGRLAESDPELASIVSEMRSPEVAELFARVRDEGRLT